MSAAFTAFWSLYPRRDAESLARAEWEHLSDAQRAAAPARLRADLQSEEWRRDGGRYIPRACIWLRRLKRWPGPLSPGRTNTQAGHVLPALPAWLAAALIALALAATHLLDGPDDHSFETAQAQELEAAQRAQAEQLATLRRAQATCGANTGVIERADGSLACATKRGRPTGVLLAGAQP
jgi:hypothetical protein